MTVALLSSVPMPAARNAPLTLTSQPTDTSPFQDDWAVCADACPAVRTKALNISTGRHFLADIIFFIYVSTLRNTGSAGHATACIGQLTYGLEPEGLHQGAASSPRWKHAATAIQSRLQTLSFERRRGPQTIGVAQPADQLIRMELGDVRYSPRGRPGSFRRGVAEVSGTRESGARTTMTRRGLRDIAAREPQCRSRPICRV